MELNVVLRISVASYLNKVSHFYDVPGIRTSKLHMFLQCSIMCEIDLSRHLKSNM